MLLTLLYILHSKVIFKISMSFLGMSDGRAGKGAGLVTLDHEVVGSNPGTP